MQAQGLHAAGSGVYLPFASRKYETALRHFRYPPLHPVTPR